MTRYSSQGPVIKFTHLLSHLLPSLVLVSVLVNQGLALDRTWADPQIRNGALWGLFALAIVATLITQVHGLKLTHFEWLMLAWWGYTILVSQLTDSLSGYAIYALTVFPLSVFSASRAHLLNPANRARRWLFSGITTALIVAYWLVPPDSYRGAAAINSIYYLVLTLPMAVQARSPFRWVFVAGIVASAVVSGKRTAVLGCLIFIAVHVVMGRRIERAREARMSATGLLVMLLIGLVLVIAVWEGSPLGLPIADRFSMVAVDGGSGRNEIFAEALSLFYASDVVHLFFGHGYQALTSMTGGWSAHNDFLETLYSFGVLGVMIQVAILISLVRTYRQLGRQAELLAAPLLASVALYVTLAGATELLMVPTYTPLLGLWWGYASAQLRWTSNHTLHMDLPNRRLDRPLQPRKVFGKA